MLVSGKINLKKLSQDYGMSLISDWLIDYKLYFHLGKTEYILFGLSLNLNWA
jgi:hypothetical protein